MEASERGVWLRMDLRLRSDQSYCEITAQDIL